VAVITGGAGGIGRAAGAKFAREGAAERLVDLEGGKLDEAVRA
jgi:NAD(P)-dependent dehydrogenase (short-subunit alcohol dehydrogenase family)